MLTGLLAATRLPAQRYVWTNFVGEPGIPGSADGSGRAARLRNPIGVAVDGDGSLYVADSANYTIRKVTAAGLLTTLAGSPGVPGSADGSNAARFRWPAGLAVDGNGTVYVADVDLRTIRTVSPTGLVTTLAGNPGNIGSADGTGTAARFNNPFGVAADDAGAIFVADTYNRTLRQVTAVGVVTTLAGLAGNPGSTDGTGSAARFYDPLGVAVDGAGNLYVADSSNHTLRKATTAGVVTTLAGLAGSSGNADGAGSAARFNLPFGVAADDAGNLYVTDSRNFTIRKVTAAGLVTTIGGTAGTSGSADGIGAAARFRSPYGIAVDRTGIVYVADASNHRISRGVPVSPPTVAEVTSPTPDGIWGVGTVIAIRVVFTQPVTVTGTPQLTLETGVTDAVVDYTNGSGTTTLTFLYTVAPEQSSPDLDCAGTGALALHGGTIRDGAANDAILTLPAPGAAHSLGANQAIVISGSALTAVLSSPAAEPTNLTPIPVLATFSEPVTGFVVGDLTVTNGTASAFVGAGAAYSFSVTPGGQGLVTVSIAAGVCANAAGTPNRAVPPLSRTYDSLSPTIVNLSSPTRNGIYGPGAVIAIRLAFSEPVTVTGTPQLTLETGATDALANCTGGSGTATLTFTYTVLAGQASADLDYAGTAALATPGGNLRDPAGNAAVLTLPTPGTPHSLGANQALVVDAVGAPNGPFLARLGTADVAAGRGLWDLSGTYSLTLAGRPLSLALVHDTGGRITGTADCSLGKATTLPLTVRGTVCGMAGSVHAKLTLRGAARAGTAAVNLTLNLALDTTARQLDGLLAGTLKLDGMTTPVAANVTLPLPPPNDGTWSVRFELLQGVRGTGGTATLALSNGVDHRLAVTGRTAGSMAVLNLTGWPADGIRIRTTIETLAGALTTLATGSGQAYGQTVSW